MVDGLYNVRPRKTSTPAARRHGGYDSGHRRTRRDDTDDTRRMPDAAAMHAPASAAPLRSCGRRPFPWPGAAAGAIWLAAIVTIAAVAATALSAQAPAAGEPQTGRGKDAPTPWISIAGPLPADTQAPTSPTAPSTPGASGTQTAPTAPGATTSPPIARTAQQRERDPAAQTYANYCAGCHGTTLSGGRAPTLLDDVWRFGGDDASLRRSIREGRAGTEMPAFQTLLKDDEVEGLIAYLRTQAGRAQKSAARAQSPAGQVLQTEHGAVAFESIADGLATPWGLAFLPDGRLLVTERPGRLRIIEPPSTATESQASSKPSSKAERSGWRLTPAPIEGTPVVWARQDGGLLDVAVHPDYARNGWIYLSYAEPGPNDTSMTAIVRGRIKDGRWVDQQTLYHAPPALFSASNAHFGSRFLFDRAGHLFYTIGDRDHAIDAQDLSKATGKIHRINDDGTIPRDNPFAAQAGAVASIWSYGHRHPQGLALDPLTGQLWETEHGPVGGDELNRVEPGHNYGWPLVSSGKILPPRPVNEVAPSLGTAPDAKAGGATPGSGAAPAPMDPPVTFWTPAIAPSGIAFYQGPHFPAWQNHLFVTGLGGEALRRLELKDNRVVHEEVLFSGFGRVRNVVMGPDGYLYVILNVPGVGLSDTTPGAIVRLVPAAPKQP